MRILIVEDEPDLNTVLQKQLRLEKHIVDGCLDGLDAQEYLLMGDYDLVILDIMIPGIDGLTLLKRLRQKSNKPAVLLLTARDSVEDRVKGLDAGADDYLVKPFAFKELLARIRMIGRKKSENATNSYIVADLEVDVKAHRVIRGEKEILLSAKEFSILEYMIRNKGIVLSRDKIEQYAWDFSYEGGSNVVDVYIRFLRKKIDDGHTIKLIHTVRGTGYVLREDT